jgi:hypothetical protein
MRQEYDIDRIVQYGVDKLFIYGWIKDTDIRNWMIPEVMQESAWRIIGVYHKSNQNCHRDIDIKDFCLA